jgi:pimeloyl-ACP methyl ester carboxylesterase
VIHERWTDTSGVRIRYLDNDPPDPVGLPIVFSPGISDDAGDYVELLTFFSPRRAIVVDVRGRGRSESPPHGYALTCLVDDLEAAIADAGFDRFHLMTFSRGTPTALHVAFRRPDRVASLSIGDYRAEEIRLPEPFVDHQWAATWRGRPMAQLMQRHVLEQIQQDSRAHDLWEEVGALEIPVLVAHGDRPGTMVTDDHVMRYRRSVPGVEIVTIPGAAHDLFRPIRTAYPAAVAEFVSRRVEGPTSRDAVESPLA